MQATKEASELDGLHRDSSSLSHNQKRQSISQVGSPKNLSNLNNLDITTTDDAGRDKLECPGCVKLGKELVHKEKEYQERINELQ